MLEGTGTCRGWGTTSRSLRGLKVHVRYCVRTYLLYGGAGAASASAASASAVAAVAVAASGNRH